MDKILVHGYCWGTAFWYAARGLCRIYDPIMVIGWFRPPSQSHLQPNDLEIYNVWTDGWCLNALALLLLVLSSAYSSGAITKSYVKSFIAVTMLHHMTTCYGAYGHYKADTHYNASMWIGVWVNVFLTAVGVVVVGGMGSESKSTRVKTL